MLSAALRLLHICLQVACPQLHPATHRASMHCKTYNMHTTATKAAEICCEPLQLPGLLWVLANHTFPVACVVA